MTDAAYHANYIGAQEIQRIAASVARKLGQISPANILRPEDEYLYKDGVVKIHLMTGWLQIDHKPDGGHWTHVFTIGRLMAVIDLATVNQAVWLDHIRGLYSAAQVPDILTKPGVFTWPS